MITLSRHRIAVLVPCYNEAATIAAIIGDFKRCLPHAVVILDTARRRQIARVSTRLGERQP